MVDADPSQFEDATPDQFEDAAPQPAPAAAPLPAIPMSRIGGVQLPAVPISAHEPGAPPPPKPGLEQRGEALLERHPYIANMALGGGLGLIGGGPLGAAVGIAGGAGSTPAAVGHYLGDVPGGLVEKATKPVIGERAAKETGSIAGSANTAGIEGAVIGSLLGIPGGPPGMIAGGVSGYEMGALTGGLAQGGVDIAGRYAPNHPLVQRGVGVASMLLSAALFHRAILGEPAEKAQGAPPKFGPDATAAAQDGEEANSIIPGMEGQPPPRQQPLAVSPQFQAQVQEPPPAPAAAPPPAAPAQPRLAREVGGDLTGATVPAPDQPDQQQAPPVKPMEARAVDFEDIEDEPKPISKPAAKLQPGPPAIAPENILKQKGVKRVIDTSDPDMQDYGNPSAFVADGELRGIHVTDDRSKVVNALSNKTRLGESYRSQGEERMEELGPGLYMSAAPQIWMGRSSGKYSFLSKIEGPEGAADRAKLGDAILNDRSMTEPGYLTSSEKENVRDYVDQFVKTGFSDPLTILAGQPYNISFWQPEFLKPLGIEPGKQPDQVPVRAKGKFLELDTYPSKELIDSAQKAGYDGAILKSGMGTDPQTVIWNNDAIQQFGSWEKPPESAKPADPWRMLSKADQDRLATLEVNPKGAVKYIKVGDLRKNPDLMKVDPERFQFKQEVDKKTGVGKDLGDIRKWNVGASGVMTSYLDPDGSEYIANGHHRLDAAMRVAPDDAYLRFQYLNGRPNEVPGALPYDDPITGEERNSGVTPSQARSYGAILNMMEQRGTPYDMAKWMRDTGSTANDLGKLGVSMNEAKTSDATAMSKLSPFLWDRMRFRELSEGKAVAIGNALGDEPEAVQNDFYKQIADRKMSPQEVTDAAGFYRGSRMIEVSSEQGKLFGGKEYRSTIPEQIKILGNFRDDLTSSSALLEKAAREQEALEKAGKTSIDRPEMEARARMQRLMQNYIPRFAYQDGSNFNTAIKRVAYDIAENPKQRNAIMERERPQLLEALQKDMTDIGVDLTGAALPQPDDEPQRGLFGGAGGGGATELGFGPTPEAMRRMQSTARYVARAINQSSPVKWYKQHLAPETLSTEAKRAGSMWEDRAAELRARTGSPRLMIQPMRDWFEAMDPAVQGPTAGTAGPRWGQYARWERGDFSGIPPEQRALAQAFRETYEEAYKNLNQVRGGRMGYIENYWTHLWADSPDKVQDFVRKFSQAGGRQLIGEKGFIQQRKYPTVEDGIVEGGLTPRFKNPADMIIAGLDQQWRYITGQRYFGDLKDAGIASFLKFGNAMPKDYKPIDDPIAKVTSWSETEKGPVQRGQYIAPEDAARVINNHLSPGLGPAGGMQLLHSVTAVGNQLRVGMSAFHIALEANSIADIQGGGLMQEALGRMANGDYAGGAKSLAKAPTMWTNMKDFYRLWRSGRNAQLKGLAGEFDDPAVRDCMLGGESFDTGDDALSEIITKAFGEKTGILPEPVEKAMAGAARGVRWVDQKTFGRIMRDYVKPIKLGALLRLGGKEVSDTIARQGGEDLNYVQRRDIFQGVRQHLDNVLGQISRDNLHTSNAMKDGLSLIFSYPGWNIGTVRLFGGIARGAGQLATGEPLDMQARLALNYAAGKALRSGIQGIIMNKLMTGEWPTTVSQIYTWPTGEKDKNGNWIRVLGPEYMTRDLMSLWGHLRKQDPNDIMRWPYALAETGAGKLNWMVEAGNEIWRNADFFGRPIRFSHVDSQSRQVWDTLEHIAAGGGIPFSVKNVIEQAKQQGVQDWKGFFQQPKRTMIHEAVAGIGGLTPVPMSLRQTPAQNYVNMVDDQQRRANIQSRPQLERMDSLRNFEATVRNQREGKATQADVQTARQQAISAMSGGTGKLMPADQKELQQRYKLAFKTPYQSALHRLPLLEVAKTWQIANNHGDTKDADEAFKALQERLPKAIKNKTIHREDLEQLKPLMAQMMRAQQKAPERKLELGAGEI